MTDAASSGNSASAEDPRLTVDVQDPLPESDWFWRRTYSYVVTAVALGMVVLSLFWLHHLGDAEAVYQIARLLCFLVFTVVTYYMVAPSAEQIVKLIQAARLIGNGAVFRRTATATTATGTTSVTTAAGTPEKSTETGAGDAIGAPPVLDSPQAPAPPDGPENRPVVNLPERTPWQ